MLLLHFECQLLDPDREVLIDLLVTEEFVGGGIHLSGLFALSVSDSPDRKRLFNNPILPLFEYHAKPIIQFNLLSRS